MALSYLRRWALKSIGRQPWLTKDFSNPRFETIGASQLIEEETLPDYLAERYYPVRIGELLGSRYQVVGKLGFGTTSTVWLARDLIGRRHVSLKVFISSSSLGPCKELAAYQRMKQGPMSHPGRLAVRSLLDSFTITGPHGEHDCLVHMPLWGSITTFITINSQTQLSIPIMATTLMRLLQALDYVHTCKIIHTDINPGNVMMGFRDPNLLGDFEQTEIDDPSPRKEVDGRMIYISRQLQNVPTAICPPVLGDFGSAEWGEEQNMRDAQPNAFRSPEVILKLPWSYEIDIWNLGCLVWALMVGNNLFHGIDPEHHEYRRRAHLAEMISLLGSPAPGPLSQGELWSKFFSEDGKFHGGIETPPRINLEQLVAFENEEDKQMFLRLIRKMLQWNPQDRHTVKQLMDDEWVRKYSRV